MIPQRKNLSLTALVCSMMLSVLFLYKAVYVPADNPFFHHIDFGCVFSNIGLSLLFYTQTHLLLVYAIDVRGYYSVTLFGRDAHAVGSSENIAIQTFVFLFASFIVYYGVVTLRKSHAKMLPAGKDSSDDNSKSGDWIKATKPSVQHKDTMTAYMS